ncbi:hypothetical protein [Blastococcus sp. PRF04-17]|uniref:hypothetical protein n=1 Tax=Blastococcus sp. PRF04-17 TaxID=2933797 RepID=UPI001FF2C543|nr:hypothetical protein [Blastococcus sp. PRF04-17]UOY02098.1 hypothetical protein MVA48_01545 [Blastococcus sp. PRF04-17]
MRRDRFATLDPTAGRPCPELQQRLGPALAPEPCAERGEPPGHIGVEAAELEYWTDTLGEVGGYGGLLGLFPAIRKGIGALAGASHRTWVVRLHARGRIRRGAMWRAAGKVESGIAAAHVADAVRTGQVPHPDGAALIDVVDHRLTVYGVRR